MTQVMSKLRKYIKADDGKFVEIEGKNGHVTSIRKVLRQPHGGSKRYGWIHGTSCMLCGMKDQGRNFAKSPCPVKKKVTKSTEDLMALHMTPKLEMNGMLESWS